MVTGLNINLMLPCKKDSKISSIFPLLYYLALRHQKADYMVSIHN